MREEFEAWYNAAITTHVERDAMHGLFREAAWEAYQAGALAMRERAAKVCESRQTPGTASVAILNGAQDAIRALPVEE